MELGGGDVMDIELWKFIVLQGGFAVLAAAAIYAWRGERAERKEYIKQLMEIAPRLVESNLKGSASLDNLTGAVNKLSDLARDAVAARRV